MKYNLLQQMYDYHADLFCDGTICFKMFQELEAEFIKRSYLFTICLN
jgi:hypothetical protein